MFQSTRYLLAGLLLGLVPLSAPAQDPNYVFDLTDTSAASGDTTTMNAQFLNLGDLVQGWSFGVCHDPSELTLNSVSDGADVATLNGGGPPSFLFTEAGVDGARMLVVVDFFMANLLDPVNMPYQLLGLNYTLTAPNGTTSVVSYCDVLGTPPVAIEVVVGGFGINPTTNSGAVAIGGGGTTPFIRGDCSGDGSNNIADVIFLLGFLFPTDQDGDGIPDPNNISCQDACDGNDDGGLNIPDAVAVLGSLFGQPAVPLPPPSTCDPDGTPDMLTCASFPGCP